MGKPSINGPFSMAMSNNQMVTIVTMIYKPTNITGGAPPCRNFAREFMGRTENEWDMMGNTWNMEQLWEPTGTYGNLWGPVGHCGFIK